MLSIPRYALARPSLQPDREHRPLDGCVSTGTCHSLNRFAVCVSSPLFVTQCSDFPLPSRSTNTTHMHRSLVSLAHSHRSRWCDYRRRLVILRDVCTCVKHIPFASRPSIRPSIVRTLGPILCHLLFLLPEATTHSRKGVWAA